MIPREERQQILLSTIEEDTTVSFSTTTLHVSSLESTALDEVVGWHNAIDDKPTQLYFERVLQCADEVMSVLGQVSPLLEDMMMCHRLQQQQELGSFQMSVGTTMADDSLVLVDERQEHIDSSEAGELKVMTLDEVPMDYDVGVDIQLSDSFFLSATTVTRIRGVSAEHLSKVWRIDSQEDLGSNNSALQAQ